MLPKWKDDADVIKHIVTNIFTTLPMSWYHMHWYVRVVMKFLDGL